MLKSYAIEVKWACIFAAMTLAWVLLEKILGFYQQRITQHETFTNFIMLPAVAVYVLALLDKRNNYYGGYITYRQAFVSGLLITLLVTILTPLTQSITNMLIAPEYFPNMIQHMVSTQQMTPQQANDFFNLPNYIVQGLIGAPIMGTLTAAIVAFFVKKAPPTAMPA